MGAIRRLRTHAEKCRSIELEESLFVLTEEENNERIQKLSESIIRIYRDLTSRRGRPDGKDISNRGVDESGAIFEEISEDLEKRLRK
ncbi:MAG: hypothetical protein AB7K68_17215 [Bacteriovoracia bacterium]